jgi:hypothetical protein
MTMPLAHLISEAAYRLVTTELTMINGIRRVLDHLFAQPHFRAQHA